VTTCARFDFLVHLPHLKLLHLLVEGPGPAAAGRVDSLIAGLQSCSELEELYLSIWDLTAAHLTNLLPRLPRLQSLELEDLPIDSLSFLSAKPVRKLVCLRLVTCTHLPLAELRHVHELRGLEELVLRKSFNAPIDAASLALLTPPSAALPQLGYFKYEAPAA